ncbi:MAG: 6-carboxytetrahydropterin synthase [Bacteroidales bacterium]|nr:6-carboxytetrahydropterin synthase [Bacteroidales bacterium]
MSEFIYITRRESFNAAHRLFREDLTNEENERIFGKCSNPLWHGHNYTLYVTVKGKIDPKTGMLMNLKDLSQLIREEVIEKIDHKNMNLEVPFMMGKLASTENLAIAIWKTLKCALEKKYPNVMLHSIKLFETENNVVEYFGE